MKKKNQFYVSLALAFISFKVCAQENYIVCTENYYLESAVNEMNNALAQKSYYSASAPTHSVGPNGHHIICVTLTMKSDSGRKSSPS